MKVRKIRPEELKRVYELFSVAFEMSYESKDTAEEVYNKLRDNPLSREDECLLEKYAAFEDDDKTMMSCIFATRYPMIYDGHSVQMTGVGGVSSLPQYRRRGGIRGCMDKLLEDGYQDGVLFAWLYPFSSNYYRKFGFENGPLCCKYKLDLSFIPKYSVAGHSMLISRENSAEMLTDVKCIYERYASGLNGMIDNEKWEYRFVTEADPYAKQEYTYVYYGEDGTPISYMTFTKMKKDGEQYLSCSRFVFTDREGLEGLLSLSASFASDHKSIIFEVPESYHIETVVQEQSFGACTMSRRFLGMVRVVNVQKVLEISKYIGSGKLAIEIIDEQIEENNGVFSVIFKDGKCISVAKGTSSPDVMMTIDQFSRFILGCSDVDGMAYAPNGRCCASQGREESLRQMFYKKPCFISEYF
jgi:predicted acetyltransferase